MAVQPEPYPVPAKVFKQWWVAVRAGAGDRAQSGAYMNLLQQLATLGEPEGAVVNTSRVEGYEFARTRSLSEDFDWENGTINFARANSVNPKELITALEGMTGISEHE